MANHPLLHGHIRFITPCALRVALSFIVYELSSLFLKSTQRTVEMADMIFGADTNVFESGEKRHSSHPELYQVNGRRTSVPSAHHCMAPNADHLTVNEARAMRVAEVMNDYQIIQRRIYQYREVVAPQDDYNEEGYRVLRQCHAEARAILAAPFESELLQVPRDPGEAEKRQLQRCAPLSSDACGCIQVLIIGRILLDASARRFQAQKIYLRAAAVIRWVNARNAILRGQKPTNGNAAAVQQLDRNLRLVRKAPLTVTQSSALTLCAGVGSYNRSGNC